ncbi:uncharacterized protein B0H18DRAFT_888284 [Fomitopsis serialis]|uniref:uncharacterized protein n=1 Tax=Fomitopsis serialis TaxID=139415 RepID=UPI002007914D|nr:uncharacterized protein B0H18DRAFT_888284 [Neoantrodia serialis]KAH9913413.1 hypothetical protein B0H18DRAFT_888284 [Neoantrodia serialis]
MPQSTTSTQHIRISLDGHDIQFDRAHLPDPPAIHFSDDISALFRDWHMSQWLRINGRGIPIKHWDKIYKKRNGLVETDAWKAIKVEWGNWKFLVAERERFPSEETFWNMYSDEKGEKLSYQQILDKLQEGRGCTDEVDYNAAMQYFGGDLDRADAHGAFRYRKSGKWIISSKKLVVARTWRKILAEDAGIRSNWEAMQQVSGSSDGCTTPL